MTNAPYAFCRVQMLTAGFNWPAEQLRLVAWAGTPDFDEFDASVADIEARGGVQLGYSQEILVKSVGSSGTAQTGPVVIPEVPIGPDITWFTMVRHGVAPVNQLLFLFIDDAFELPFVTNGLDVVLQPDWLQQRGWFRP